MNSLPRPARPAASHFSLRKYSTALTSWFVVRSISLHRRASASEKSAATDRHAASQSPTRTPRSSATVSLREMRYSTSTRTRYLISAASEKYSRTGATRDAYRPSSGVSACNS